MIKKFIKQIIAGGLVFAIINGVVPFEPINSVLSVTAQAEESTVSFDALSGTLTLRGNVDLAQVQAYRFNSGVKMVIAAEGTVLPASCNRMFYRFEANTINLLNADTSQVTDMFGMFENCPKLEKLRISNFNTSNVTHMGSMFYGCSSLTSLDVSSFDTSKVTDMYYMFSDCAKITSFDLKNFNTSAVKQMHNMFNGCTSLESVDLSSFDTSNVTTMAHMFDNCTGLSELDLRSFDTSKLEKCNSMFENSSTLKTIYVSDKWDMSGVTTSSQMFLNCTSLKGGNGTTYDSSQITAKYACIDTADSPGYLSQWFSAVFDEDTDTLTLRGNVVLNEVTAYSRNANVKKVVAEAGTVLPENCAEMFGDFYYTETIDLSKANTSSVKNMYGMFKECRALENFDISGFNTSNVTKMSALFFNCKLLTTIDLKNFDTSNVEDMRGMFQYCDSLTELDLSGFDTSKVTDMSGMFNECKSLTSLDLSNFDTSNVTSMTNLFWECEKLESVDLSSFDTSKITKLDYMFYKCSELTVLDLSSFDTSSIESSRSAFEGDSKLTTVYVGDGWDMSNVSSSSKMFSDCKNIVGGNGTTYHSGHVNAAYARIDTTETPGYLTNIMCGVVFDAGDYPNPPETQTVRIGEKAKIPSVSDEYQGKFLSGWYTDSEYTEKFDFDTPITNDIVLYAKWDEVVNTISSNLPSGSTYTVYYGDDIKLSTSNSSSQYSYSWMVKVDGVTVVSAPSQKNVEFNTKLLTVGKTAEVTWIKAIAGTAGKATAHYYYLNVIYKQGDINGDGVIDSEDAAKLLKHISGADILDSEVLKRADTDYNGEIDVRDVVGIIKKA